MNSNYLNRIIKISTNDNRKAQRILHKMGDNEWSKTLCFGSSLMIILLLFESILLTNVLPILSIIPLLILFIISKEMVILIINYLRYRRYLLDSNVINTFGICKDDKRI
jgi:hypothetical protein